MDPIEVFELSGYVVQAVTSPGESLFASELRLYVIQVTGSPDSAFASEMRMYAVEGRPQGRAAILKTSTYMVEGKTANRAAVKQSNAYIIEVP